MKTERRHLFLLFLGIFVVALIGCAIGCSIAMRLAMEKPPVQVAGDPHDWLHDQLNLSENQEKDLEEIEKRFAAEEARLQGALDDANRELAENLRADRDYSPAVEASIEKIHHAMAALQKATVAHLIDMREVLSDEQFDQLLELAGESLSH